VREADRLAGLVGFAVPFTLWSYGASQVRPGVAAAGLNLIPVVGVLSAAVFGRGLPSVVQLVGGLVILVGLALLSRAPQRAPDAQPEARPALDAVPCSSR
jgi:drug/metabolite transporter (DMT)-like permease